MKKSRSGVFLISSRDRANEKWTVLYLDAAGAGAEALYDRTAKTLDLLAENQTVFAESKPAST